MGNFFEKDKEPFDLEIEKEKKEEKKKEKKEKKRAESEERADRGRTSGEEQECGRLKRGRRSGER